MKRIAILFLAAGLLLGTSSTACAIDFKLEGEWLMGFGAGQTNLVNKVRKGDEKRHADTDDVFTAAQRLLLKLEAVASENLSGTVYFEIGDTIWGQSESGGALGADSTSIIKLKNAYLDWDVPGTDLKFRIGIQPVTMPNQAGGSAVFDTDAAGIISAYQFNDNVGLTALWVRPFNDNYAGYADGVKPDYYRANFLDNMDLFALLLPLKFDGFEATPWVMYGMRGKNTAKFDDYQTGDLGDGLPVYTFGPYPSTIRTVDNNDHQLIGNTKNVYGNMFWAGLPFAVTALDPLNIEVDVNYGYVEGMGHYDAEKSFDGVTKRSNTQRQGWLAKALIEYKMDWGVPGIFCWYASGDDGNPRNGSERMPSVAPFGNFTSFIGDGNMGWAPSVNYLDYNTGYAGTWGIGARVKDISFAEDLKHTIIVTYWGGTNSPAMIKYMDSSTAWNESRFMENYMTTNDGLLEINLVNAWHIYENLEMNLEFGYVVNFMDNNTWKKAGNRDTSFEKLDIWKTQVVFAYSF
ncbi:MAG: outer membrane homotrimeric porin [Desulfovibrio sp.]|jgi:hypothetical protein|nr:outer membrane homotrimeric porin [Desulfovibrio sp.]